MPNDTAIRVAGLSKAYTIHHNQVRHSTTAEAVLHRLRHPFQRAEKETFWALRDLDFEVKKGDVVGIIGRNGAGKSTLLKVLSRITEPTAGRIELFGRVGSLLEVGTGFHPELTGRENIFLNGAILGMTRAEIRKQFDAIVDFAGVEQFLDTPVKRYSSGMYVRLAFAVAAHLETEILIVDEVLAVGDAEFQKKCLGKMKDVAGQGRTVLFVSHNMAAVRSLCNRALVLHQGAVVCNGSTEQAIAEYGSVDVSEACASWIRTTPANGALNIERVSVDLAGEQPHHTLNVNVQLDSARPHPPAFIAVDILDAAGGGVMQALPTIEGFIDPRNKRHDLDVLISLPPMIPGQYWLTIWVGSHNTETLDQVRECVAFEIKRSPTANRTVPHTPDHGYIVPESTVTYPARGTTQARQFCELDVDMIGSSAEASISVGK